MDELCVYKIVYHTGSIIPYKGIEIKQLYKSVESALKDENWISYQNSINSADPTSGRLLSDEEVMKIDYLKSDLEKSVKHITWQHKNGGVIESSMIVKVDLL